GQMRAFLFTQRTEMGGKGAQLLAGTLQALLGLLALGDVAHDRENERLLVKVHAVEADLGVEFGAVEALGTPLETLRDTEVDGADFFQSLARGKLSVGLELGREAHGRLPDNFLQIAAKKSEAVRIATNEAVAAHHKNGVLGRLKERTITEFAAA